MAASSLNTKPLTERIRAPFTALRQTMGRQTRAWSGWDNDYIQRMMSATYGNNPLPGVGTDALDNALLNGAVMKGFITPIRLNITANSKIATTRFFSNNNDTTPLEIVAITAMHATANGAALTAYVSKDKAGQAPGAGTSVMSGTFNLNATANTLQTATLASTLLNPTVTIRAGESLSLKLSTTVTSLAGLSVIVYVRPHTQAAFAQYYRAANGDIATGTMYLNLIPGQVVRSVAISWGTAGTDAGAVTADITKDTSTNAPGAGTSILAAAQSVKGTANTTVYPTLATSTSTLTMASGDRLAVKMTGTLTALTDLVVTVFFNASATDHIVIPVSSWDGAATDRSIFTVPAGEHYIVSDFWQTWSTASTSNTQLLTKDTGTTAPGAGTGLVTDNTNAGILTSSTANTPVGSLTLSAVSTKPTLWLAPGDRLGLKNAGTTGSLAGVFTAVVLRRA
jgi:hypothetical protein